MDSISIEGVDMLLKLIILLGISLLSYRKKYLDFKGVLAAFFIGGLILFLGGWGFFFLLFIFLLVGSVLSKTAKSESFDFAAYFNGSSIRGWRNVLANGFWPTYAAIMYFLTPPYYRDYAIVFFVGALTSMMSDTVSTEIGLHFGGEPRLIINPKERVPKGYSGGITVEGILGGLVSSLIFSLLSIYIFNLVASYFYSIFVISGFLGSVVDSILGATIQAKYKCIKCGSIIESSLHCGYPAILIKGFESIDNHMVNFLSSLFGGVASVTLFSLLL